MGGKLSAKVDRASILSETRKYPVVMYSKPNCGYCKMAKQLFREENIKYEEKDLDLVKAMKPDRFQDYLNGLVYITRITTVPQIFICGEFIGGYSELNRLREAKNLWKKIEHCADQYDIADL